MLPRPRALLLDFGGVIVDEDSDPTWTTEVARMVTDLLVEAGVDPPPVTTIVEDLVAGRRGDDAEWRQSAPVQPGCEEFWGERICARWPDAARRVAVANAQRLVRAMAHHSFAHRWRPRPGIKEVLAYAFTHDLPMAIVSNTICGAAHRDFLALQGLDGYLAAQFYSDEERVRKPNPELARRASRAIGVPLEHCWFVGDTLTRDVLVARRSGCAAAILMRSRRVERPPLPDVIPDAVVADPVELLALLRA